MFGWDCGVSLSYAMERKSMADNHANAFTSLPLLESVNVVGAPVAVYALVLSAGFTANALKSLPAAAAASIFLICAWSALILLEISWILALPSSVLDEGQLTHSANCFL